MSSMLEKLPIISGSMVKILETPQGYFLNGVYHNKETLNAQPNGAYSILGDYSTLGMWSGATVGDSMVSSRNSGNWVFDNDNPDISYVAYSAPISGTTHIFKVYEKDGELISLERTPPLGTKIGGSDRSAVKQILTQTDTHLFVSVPVNTGSAASGSPVYIAKINKKDLSDVTGTHTSHFAYLTKVHENNDFLYFIDNQPSLKYLKRMSKTNAGAPTITTVGTLPRPNDKYDVGDSCIVEDVVGADAGVKDIYMLSNEKIARESFRISKIRIDVSRDDTGLVIVNPLEVLPIDTVIDIPDNHYHRSMHLKKLVRGDRTFFLFHTENLLQSLYASRLCLYEALNYGKDGEEFKLIERFTDLEAVGANIRSVMGIDDDWDRILVFAVNALHFYKWDHVRSTYELTDTKPTIYTSVGTTREQIVMGCTSDGRLDVMNPIALSKIDVQMDQTRFQFSNKPINTNCRVAAFNIDNEMISKSVRLTCTHGAKFALTDSRTIDVMTNTEAYVEVEIIITSGTNFTILSAPVV